MDHEWTWDSEHENWKRWTLSFHKCPDHFREAYNQMLFVGKHIEPFQACFNHLESMYIHNPSTWACGKKTNHKPMAGYNPQSCDSTHGQKPWGTRHDSMIPGTNKHIEMLNRFLVDLWILNTQKNVNKCKNGVVAWCKGVCKWAFTKLHSMTLLATATTTPSQPPAN